MSSCSALDLIFLLDISDASDGRRDSIEYIRASAITMIRDLEPCVYSGAIHISIITFHTSYVVEVDLDRERSISELENIISGLRKESRSSTDLSRVLGKAEREFENKGRSGVEKLLIILSNAKPSDSQFSDITRSAESVKTSGIFIYTFYSRTLYDEGLVSRQIMQDIAST